VDIGEDGSWPKPVWLTWAVRRRELRYTKVTWYHGRRDRPSAIFDRKL